MIHIQWELSLIKYSALVGEWTLGGKTNEVIQTNLFASKDNLTPN